MDDQLFEASRGQVVRACEALNLYMALGRSSKVCIVLSADRITWISEQMKCKKIISARHLPYFLKGTTNVTGDVLLLALHFCSYEFFMIHSQTPHPYYEFYARGII